MYVCFNFLFLCFRLMVDLVFCLLHQMFSFSFDKIICTNYFVYTYQQKVDTIYVQRLDFLLSTL